MIPATLPATLPGALTGVLDFPGFNPILYSIGPFFGVGPLQIHWYALAYIASLVVGWRIVRHLVRLLPIVATHEQTDDFLTWATLGVVLGGRLGYIVLYRPLDYLADPLSALTVWKGGMSFHGGAIGVLVALYIFTRRNHMSFLGFSDRVATVLPIGLGLGRIGNFINGELWGRPADPSLPWAMRFPMSGTLEPRHPSQLYQMGMEGILLGLLLAFLCSRATVRAHLGTIGGVFLAGYGVARIIGEHFREPDAFIGFLPGHITLGQLYSYPMLIGGLVIVVWAMRRPPVPLDANLLPAATDLPAEAHGAA